MLIQKARRVKIPHKRNKKYYSNITQRIKFTDKHAKYVTIINVLFSGNLITVEKLKPSI